MTTGGCLREWGPIQSDRVGRWIMSDRWIQNSGWSEPPTTRKKTNIEKGESSGIILGVRIHFVHTCPSLRLGLTARAVAGTSASLPDRRPSCLKNAGRSAASPSPPPFPSCRCVSDARASKKSCSRCILRELGRGGLWLQTASHCTNKVPNPPHFPDRIEGLLTAPSCTPHCPTCTVTTSARARTIEKGANEMGS